MQIVSLEMSKPIFLKNKKNTINLLSAELTPGVVKVNFWFITFLEL